MGNLFDDQLAVLDFGDQELAFPLIAPCVAFLLFAPNGPITPPLPLRLL
jgi:hypothetical protein